MTTVDVVTAIIGSGLLLFGALGGLLAWVLKSLFDGLRGEMDGLRAELRGEIGGLRGEIQALDRSLTAEIRGLRESTDARLTALERAVWSANAS